MALNAFGSSHIAHNAIVLHREFQRKFMKFGYNRVMRENAQPVQVPQNITDSLCDWLEDGNTLRAWCRIPGNPKKSTIYDWEKLDPIFAGRIARAREIGEIEISEDSMEIIDEKPTYIDELGRTRIDPAGVQRNRIRAEHRLKLLAKWNPRKWGEKQELNVTGSLDLAGRLSAARERKK